MKWTMDALLPAEQRFSSLKFRRVARRFDATRLDYADACELVAFTRTIGARNAQWIFHWRGAGVRECDRLLKHLSGSADVDRMVAENMAVPTRADGLAVLRAMQDGGWTRGGVPPCVRLSVLDMLDEGMTRNQVAAALGVTLDQVRVFAYGHRVRPRSRGLSGLVAE